MAKVKNWGVATINKSNEIKIYSLSKPKDLDKSADSLELEDSLEGLMDDALETLENKTVNITRFGEYDEQNLIEESSFYLDLDSQSPPEQFAYIKKGLRVRNENLLSEAPQIGVDQESLTRLDNKDEKIKFLILEVGNQFFLAYINPYSQIIKHKVGISVGKYPTKLAIDYGIVFPNYLSAVLDIETGRLSVISVIDFERMFALKYVRLTRAQDVMDKFRNGTYSLGRDNINIEFGESVQLTDKKYNKSRQITYLSAFNADNAQYATKSIEDAMQHLPQNQRLIIRDNKIKVDNELQFKTFVAILHDSILHRILSDSWETI